MLKLRLDQARVEMKGGRRNSQWWGQKGGHQGEEKKEERSGHGQARGWGVGACQQKLLAR